MSTHDPLYGTTSSDPLTPTGEQGSTNEAERLDDRFNDPETWTANDDLEGFDDEPGAGEEQGTSGMAGQAQEKAGDMASKAQEMGQAAQEKAADMGQKAQEKADAGMDAAASGLGQAASMLRQQGEQHQGSVGTAAARTADTLDQASTYLRDKDTSQVLDDIEAFVRERPVESVLIAAGIGFVLSRIVK
jgi:ElaB/YqjD/DUF883 family membrane-anchored ribosome-binding protein